MFHVYPRSPAPSGSTAAALPISHPKCQAELVQWRCSPPSSQIRLLGARLRSAPLHPLRHQDCPSRPVQIPFGSGSALRQPRPSQCWLPRRSPSVPARPSRSHGPRCPAPAPGSRARLRARLPPPSPIRRGASRASSAPSPSTPTSKDPPSLPSRRRSRRRTTSWWRTPSSCWTRRSTSRSSSPRSCGCTASAAWSATSGSWSSPSSSIGSPASPSASSAPPSRSSPPTVTGLRS